MAGEGGDLDSYFCSVLRLMPLSGIDPSLALGFYCRGLGARCCFGFLKGFL